MFLGKPKVENMVESHIHTHSHIHKDCICEAESAESSFLIKPRQL